MATPEVIRAHRERLGLTQAQLAERIGVGGRQVRRWEANESEPSFLVARALAQVLGITLEELAGEPVQRMDLSGTWWAAWQTWHNGDEIINPHLMEVTQRGNDLDLVATTRGRQSWEEGGYLWKGQAHLWDNEVLMGWYVGTEAAVRSKGTMYFLLHQHGHQATGRWVGLSHDGPIITGWAALARESEQAVLRIMDTLCHPEDEGFS